MKEIILDTPGAIQLTILIILVLLSGFFSSAETALTTCNRVRMKNLEEEGNKRAVRVNKILEHNSKMLSAILIGNNIVNLSASAIATNLAIRSFGIPVGIMTGILTFVILLLGEVVPKTWAMVSSEKLSLAYSGLISGLMVILTPLIFIIDKLGNLILRIFGIDPDKRESMMTESELRSYVDVSHEEGVIEKEEKEIIYNVFDFSDSVAKDIMIPRVRMVTVDVEDDYDTILNVFRECMYTRLPVYEEDKDHIIGLINIKDFILCKDPASFSVRETLREGFFTHEFKKTSDLLEEMRKATTNIAFVLNEYGMTIGMITLEDLLEEIVGEIRDEYDEDEKELVKYVEDRTYLVEAALNLDDLNDAIGSHLESEEYDSVGGVIIEHLDHLPTEGEQVTLEDGTLLTVSEMDGNRIEKVTIVLPDPKDEEGEDDAKPEKSDRSEKGDKSEKSEKEEKANREESSVEADQETKDDPE